MSQNRPDGERSGEFAGLPAGRLATTALPNLLFTELLADADDLAELKVALHIFWTLAHRPRKFPGMRLGELRTDPLLQHSLSALAGDPKETLAAALDRAVARGALLRIAGRWKGAEETWVFVNSAKGRDAVERLVRGESGFEPLAADIAEPAPPARRSIFALYEQNVGLVQPIIAQELVEAEETYPAEWIEDAFRIAAGRNVRNWRYIRAILQRWATEGKDDEENR
jgi:DnaD/phage-associated family protein